GQSLALHEVAVRSRTRPRAHLTDCKLQPDAGRTPIRHRELARRLRRVGKAHRLTYGSGGTKGSPGHLTREQFRMRDGFDIVHVAYKGNPQIVADLTGGHIQAGFLATPSVIELVREGKLRGLAVSGSHRAPSAPQMPTVAEAGYPD